MHYWIANKYTLYEIDAASLEEAKATAERHHVHAAKRGWTWEWEARRDGLGWFLNIRNSKGTEMRSKGYGCSLFTRDPIVRG